MGHSIILSSIIQVCVRQKKLLFWLGICIVSISINPKGQIHCCASPEIHLVSWKPLASCEFHLVALATSLCQDFLLLRWSLDDCQGEEHFSHSVLCCWNVNCRLFVPQGWAKTSHSLDASEENDGWSSAEEPLNSSDAEEEGGGGGERNEMKLVTRNAFLLS